MKTVKIDFKYPAECNESGTDREEYAIDVPDACNTVLILVIVKGLLFDSDWIPGTIPHAIVTVNGVPLPDHDPGEGF